MKNRVIAFVLVVTLILSIAPLAFAQEDEFVSTFDIVGPAEEGELAGVDPSGQTVEYWYRVTGGDEEALQEKIAEFNENNPWGITVEGVTQGGYGELYQKMIAGIAADEMPDLIVAYQNQAAAYELDGVIVDMDMYVNDPTWGFNEAEQADFFSGVFASDYNPQFGERLGFPPQRSMEALWVNLDALAELGYDGPPTTWEEFGEMACAWTESAEGRMGYSIRTDASFIAAATFALGGDIFDIENDEYVYNGEETVYVMTVLADLLEAGCVNRVAEQYGDQSDFTNQVNLFYAGSTSGMEYVAAGVAESEAGEFAWTVAPMPYGDLGATEPTQNMYGASVSVVESTPETQLAAWLFVRWMDEPEQLAFWAENSGYYPVRHSVVDLMGDFLDENPEYAAGFALTANTKTEPPIASYDVIRDLAEEEGFFSILDGADIEETLTTLTDDANDIYQTQFQP